MMRTRTAMALGASLTLATAQLAWAQAAPEAAPPPREGMAMPHPAGNDPIANEGVLIFNRSDVFTAPNEISGAGELRKIGAGTLILSGKKNSW